MYPTEAELFRQACRVNYDEPLPYAVEQAYWDYKWARDAIDSSPLRLEEICLIVVLAGYAKNKGKRPDSPIPLADLLKSGAVADGDPIEVTWKFGHPIVGQFRGYAKVRGTVLVQLPDEATPREFSMERVVGLPTPTEA